MRCTMADYNSTVMSPDEVSALKETLYAQQKLLQKLYNELDAEREASATATKETVSKIQRLEGEKSAVKMEAEQYKRVAEEKMCHVEESLAIIQDIFHQKDMEVAALSYQVEAYRYKLLSMGCADLLQRNENVACDTSLGRRNSAPLLVKFNRALIERDSNASPEIDGLSSFEEINEFITSDSSDKKSESPSLQEQIRKLGLQVKEFAIDTSSANNNRTRSPSPQLSFDNSFDTNKDQENNPYAASTSVVLDVFEVPQVDRSIDTSYESSSKDKKKTGFFQASEILESREAVKLHAKDESDWLKKLLYRPSDITAIDRALVVQPSTSVAQCRPDLNNRALGVSEIERVSENSNREEVLKLLKEIKEQISLLQDEVRCQKGNKSSTRENSSLHSLSEAMFHFWL
ncbi:hypothetical protein ABFS82_10G127200 [Erythranthe guttata]|nr:PREDICTED: uncharacterized protein LOC105958398 [Erythranthe guttata]|eukprot:XP_012837865.1 PREDICTED: uncharacterized protein LOC105958398 [Erythranthe guttata]